MTVPARLPASDDGRYAWGWGFCRSTVGEFSQPCAAAGRREQGSCQASRFAPGPFGWRPITFIASAIIEPTSATLAGSTMVLLSFAS